MTPRRSPDSERLAELTARYREPALLADARHACELSRQSGRMADSVWLRTLEQLAAYDTDVAEYACRTLVEQYPDGSRGERYLVGIARGEAKRRASRAAQGIAGMGALPAQWRPARKVMDADTRRALTLGPTAAWVGVLPHEADEHERLLGLYVAQRGETGVVKEWREQIAAARSKATNQANEVTA